MKQIMIATISWLLLVLVVKGDYTKEDIDESNLFLRNVYTNSSRAHRRLTTSYLQLIKDKFTEQYLQEVRKNNSNYVNRTPFPYAVVDNFFPQEVVDAVLKEIPDNPQILPNHCVKGNNVCFNSRDEKYKNAYEDETNFGPATTAVFLFMKSSIFINFLQRLTKIKDIVPDPHYSGSGIHQTLSNGYLEVHADFNRYTRFDLHRRVNCFLYLNDNWKKEYGGHLELWHENMETCGARILPLANRFVAFSSTDFSFHGHPEPLGTPSTRSRRSIALYYYTRTRPRTECRKNNCDEKHNSLFQTRPCHCHDPKCQKNFVDL